MTKVLITVHLGRHFYKFGQYDMDVLLDMVDEVHIAANFSDSIDFYENPRVIKHQIDFHRNPFHLQNIKAFFQVRKLMRQESFNVVHTQSPSGGVITRLASFKLGQSKMVYTPHGYHFFKGASKLNWLIFYNIEKILSLTTDYFITINKEDYNLTKSKFNIKENEVFLIPGVGVDLEKFQPAKNDEKSMLRTKYGYSEETKIFIYVAELSKRKNQILIIDAIVKLLSEIKDGDFKILLVGQGNDKENLEKKINEFSLQPYIELLGQRKDVNDLLKLSDVYLSTSFQEGLPLSVMEAMASGLPLLLSDSRGNRDLVEENKNGELFDFNIEDFSRKLMEFIDLDNRYLLEMRSVNLELIEKYSIENVQKNMKVIYSKILDDIRS